MGLFAKKYLRFFPVILLLTVSLAGQTHFTPVDPTGMAYHIIVEEITINNAPVSGGTEVGVFDGDLCVGSVQIAYDGAQNIDIVVWEGNQTYQLPGYTAGQPISFKIYCEIYQEFIELSATPNYKTGDGTFGYGSYTVLSLTANSQDQPEIFIQEPKIEFGEVFVGSTGSQQLTVENKGTAALMISLIQVESDQCYLSVQQLSIPAGEQREITVSYQPTQPTPLQTVLKIHSDDPQSPVVTIPVYGQGIPPVEPTISVSPQSLQFGLVRIGDSESLILQIFNYGQSVLNISDIYTSNAVFQVENSQFEIPSGSSISLEIIFIPQSVSAYTGSLTIQSNANNGGSYSVSLYGSGFDGYFQPVPETGLPYIIVVQNVTIDGHTLASGDEIAVFDGDQCVGSSVYYGAYPVQVTVWESDPANNLDGFTPGNPISFKLRATTYGQTIEIIPETEWLAGGTFGAGAYSVANLNVLSGLEPHLSVASEKLDLGQTTINTQISKTFAIQNTGLSTLTINYVSTANSAFRVEPSGMNIPPDGTEYFTIYFTPSLPIIYSTSLNIQSNDPDQQNFSVELTGQGLSRETRYLYAPSSHVKFAPIPVFTAEKQTINLFNAGSGPISVYSVSIAGGQFSADNSQFNIEPGAIYPLTVTFIPDGPGYFDSEIQINNNSENQPQLSLSLSGIGYESYFTPVQPTGLPYTIIIKSIDTSATYSIKAGDEFGIFDRRLCVGKVIIDTSQVFQSGIVWEKNTENNLPGFTAGNPINVQYARRRDGSAVPYEVKYEIIEGNGLFSASPYTSMRLIVTDIPVISAAPTGLQTLDSLQAIQIQWDANSEEDLAYYKIYRGADAEFTADSESLIDSISSIYQAYIDTLVQNNTVYYYKITAVDNDGWESPPSVCLKVSAIVVKVWDVSFHQRKDGSGLVDIYYSFSGQDTTRYNVVPQLKENSTADWTEINSISGDAGSMTPGINRHLIWDLMSDKSPTYTATASFKIIIEQASADGMDMPIDGSNAIKIDERIKR